MFIGMQIISQDELSFATKARVALWKDRETKQRGSLGPSRCQPKQGLLEIFSNFNLGLHNRLQSIRY